MKLYFELYLLEIYLFHVISYTLNVSYQLFIAEVAAAWLDSLLSCIDKLPKEVVKKDVS